MRWSPHLSFPARPSRASTLLRRAEDALSTACMAGVIALGWHTLCPPLRAAIPVEALAACDEYASVTAGLGFMGGLMASYVIATIALRCSSEPGEPR